jgi:glycosyltransferase involved in cell wall biosynthesis
MVKPSLAYQEESASEKGGRELSVVVPVFNEEDNVQPLIEAISDALNGIDYEVLLVDDCSTDRTRQRARTLVSERVILIELKKNYGQSTAMAAGVDHSTGEYVAFMDGDLQNDPTDIPMMMEKIRREEWDIVAGNRRNRQDGFVLRKVPSRIANWLIRRITKVGIRDFGCTLKVMRRETAQELQLHGEMHRFIPAIAGFAGASMTEVDVKHHPRRHGKSKYNLSRTFRVISDLMLLFFLRRYSQKPMHIFGTAGFIAFMAGLAINAYLLLLKIMGQDIWGKPLLILGMILLFGGIQLITIGILADIGLRTNHEVSGKPGYRVGKTYGGRAGS